MVSDLVVTALSACEGIEFSERAACPDCGGPVQGYDTKRKKFAAILENDRERIIHVRVRRFTCKSCGLLCYADEPFYPDTRIGSPVIDLCVTFSSTLPFSRTATYLSRIGIAIDRGSVRNYAKRSSGKIPTADMFGIRLPFSILSLSSLAARSGESGGISGTDVLTACGFPSIPRAALNHKKEEGQDRKEREE